MWTSFWDMNSGGGIKEPPYDKIYIEAPEEEAKVIFYNRFGHNPERVTCTCCGEDYTIDSHEDLAQLTGFHRGCRNISLKKYDEKNKTWDSRYIEKGEETEVPNGYKLSKAWASDKYMTLAEYEKQEHVLVIRSYEIKPEERRGEVPVEGYVWMG